VNALNFGIAVLSEFEVDISTFVRCNHQLTITELHRLREIEIEAISELDYETLSSAQGRVWRQYEELESAANQLALVALLTRLDVWLNKLIADHPVEKSPTIDEKYTSSIAKKMARLAAPMVEATPIPIEYFADLATVRDSVIHHDARSTFDYHGPHTVAERYRSAYENVLFTAEDLTEATKKAIEQYHAFEAAWLARRVG